MAAHTEEQFEQFFAQFQETNVSLADFCDFSKIYQNVENIAIDLNTLNFLVGKYNRQNQMSPFCKTKRLKNLAHIHRSGHQNNAHFCYFIDFQTPFERHLKPPSPTHIQCSRVDPQNPFSNTNQA